MIVLFVSILAGAIGATVAEGQWPERSMSGVLNIALGLIGGTAIWAAFFDFAFLEPSISAFLTLLMLGSLGGATLTLGLGSLRNILRDAT